MSTPARNRAARSRLNALRRTGPAAPPALRRASPAAPLVSSSSSLMKSSMFSARAARIKRTGRLLAAWPVLATEDGVVLGHQLGGVSVQAHEGTPSRLRSPHRRRSSEQRDENRVRGEEGHLNRAGVLGGHPSTPAMQSLYDRTIELGGHPNELAPSHHPHAYRGVRQAKPRRSSHP